MEAQNEKSVIKKADMYHRLNNLGSDISARYPVVIGQSSQEESPVWQSVMAVAKRKQRTSRVAMRLNFKVLSINQKADVLTGAESNSRYFVIRREILGAAESENQSCLTLWLSYQLEIL